MLHARIEGGVLCFVWNTSEEEKLLISALWQPLCYILLLLHFTSSSVHPCSLRYSISLLHIWLQAVSQAALSTHCSCSVCEHGSGSQLSIRATFNAWLRCTAISWLCEGHRDVLHGCLQNVSITEANWGAGAVWPCKNPCVCLSSPQLYHFASHLVHVGSNLVTSPSYEGRLLEMCGGWDRSSAWDTGLQSSRGKLASLHTPHLIVTCKKIQRGFQFCLFPFAHVNAQTGANPVTFMNVFVFLNISWKSVGISAG